jgi:hypothetical protein
MHAVAAMRSCTAYCAWPKNTRETNAQSPDQAASTVASASIGSSTTAAFGSPVSSSQLSARMRTNRTAVSPAAQRACARGGVSGFSGATACAPSCTRTMVRPMRSPGAEASDRRGTRSRPCSA